MSLHVAYLTTRFPKVSETFIANEIAAVRRHGVEVTVFAYLREGTDVVHPVAAEMMNDVVFPRRRDVALDQVHWLARHPRRYANAWKRAIVGNIRSPRFLLRALMTVPIAASFARRIQDLGVDHVHAHYATHSALGAFVVNMLTGVPYSITAHAHDIQVNRTMLADKVSAASFTVAISEFNGAMIRDHLGASRPAVVELVRCGVDTAVFDDVARPVRTPVRVAIVASLEERKGHELLLRATRRVIDGGDPLHVDIVGDGPAAESIDACISRLSLAPHVTRGGALTAPEVTTVLREADVFVLPSLTQSNGKMEGIPVALMEAMATGLPVVATRMSGIPELVVDGVTGLLVDEGSVGGLEDAIRRLARSPDLRRRIGRSAREHVCREFDQERNVTKLVDLFRNSVREHTPRQKHAMLPDARLGPKDQEGSRP